MRTIEQLEAIVENIQTQLSELKEDRSKGVDVSDWKETQAHRELKKYTDELEERREEKAALDKAKAEVEKRHAEQQAAVLEAAEEAYTVLKETTVSAAEAHKAALQGLPAYREARAIEVEAYRNLRGLVEQLDEPEHDDDGNVITDRIPFYKDTVGNVMHHDDIVPGKYGRALDRI